MRIASIQPLSLSDFPPYATAVVFTIGCNLRCSYCHNKNLWDDNFHPIAPKEVLDFLTKRKGKLDGVVITGGEPTIQKELVPFAKQIKELGYKIKLNTNGTNPNIIRELIELKLVDYIAMDIKGPLDMYQEICGVGTFSNEIRNSIALIAASNIAHEFRTVYDQKALTEEDIKKIKFLLPKKSKHIIIEPN